MASTHYITAAELRSALHYDPLTGVFTWREKPEKPKWWNTKYAGKVAGGQGTSGRNTTYLTIRIGGRRYYAHRLAWLYVHGEWADGVIDHINGDGLDNRIANLRLASNAQNLANRGRQKNNASGYKGVHFEAWTGRYKARIQHGGKSYNLGRFDTPEEAHEAYKKAAAERFGEFARAE